MKKQFVIGIFIGTVGAFIIAQFSFTIMIGSILLCAGYSILNKGK